MPKVKKTPGSTLYALRSNKGFTLIELLVVISIIGVLTALSLTSYSGAQKQTRDTQRRSDLNQYRNSLEAYASSNNGLYPDCNDTSLGSGCIWGASSYLVPDYMSSAINDPIQNSTHYYIYDGYDSGLNYSLRARLLETGGFWEVCSSGKTCPLSGTGEDDADGCGC